MRRAACRSFWASDLSTAFRELTAIVRGVSDGQDRYRSFRCAARSDSSAAV
jgi:hypothetical protein